MAGYFCCSDAGIILGNGDFLQMKVCIECVCCISLLLFPWKRKKIRYKVFLSFSVSSLLCNNNKLRLMIYASVKGERIGGYITGYVCKMFLVNLLGCLFPLNPHHVRLMVGWSVIIDVNKCFVLFS